MDRDNWQGLWVWEAGRWIGIIGRGCGYGRMHGRRIGRIDMGREAGRWIGIIGRSCGYGRLHGRGTGIIGRSCGYGRLHGRGIGRIEMSERLGEG